jgi:diguanylate cyclase (GGDEF)-like protein/PAS domain S-box-containing protein
MIYINTVCNIDTYSKLKHGVKVKIVDIVLFLLIVLVLYLLKRTKFYRNCCKNRTHYQLQNNLMLDAIGYGICAVDNNGHCLSINETALKMLDVLKHEVLDENIEDIFCNGVFKSNVHTKKRCPIFKTIKDKKKRIVKEHITKKNGTSIHLSLNVSPFEDSGAVVVFRDITTEILVLQELNQRNIELDKLATTDGLSGLYNRRYFDDNLQIEYDRASRGGTSFTLGICDIDNFKLYNDNYGHVKGDEVIRAVTKVLKHTFNRQTDIVARYGGEEFVFILVATPKESAFKLTQKAKKDIEELSIEHSFNGISKFITISFGVVHKDIQKREISVSELLNIADSALYKSKENGKNMITFENI